MKNGTNQDLPVPQAKQNRHKLTDEQIIFLAKLGHQLQQHYYYPQDIEWAIDKDKVYLVQSRPVTTLMAPPKITSAVNTDSLTQILRGEPASPGIATGYVRILKSAKEINLLKTNEILVTEMTTPDFVPAMKKPPPSSPIKAAKLPTPPLFPANWEFPVSSAVKPPPKS